MTLSVGIYLFDEIEILDFAGPYEVFNTASRVKQKLTPELPRLFDTFLVAEEKRAVKTRGAMEVWPRYDFASHPPLDVLIIPGGVMTAELERESVVQWISRAASRTKITASVCTGAFLLAKAGLLDGKTATTHWEDIPDFREMFPAIALREKTRWVDNGQVVTSAGISAGTDMSLHLVARLAGEDLARQTAHQMEYDWNQAGV